MSAAVMVGDQYVVSGTGEMALNVTHPSPLDEDFIEYLLHLTPDLLPEMEEVVVPGPLKQEITIQVWKRNLSDYSRSSKWYFPRPPSHQIKTTPWTQKPPRLEIST